MSNLDKPNGKDICVDCADEALMHECPRCGHKDHSVLLDSDGEPYMCDGCWDECA